MKPEDDIHLVYAVVEDLNVCPDLPDFFRVQNRYRGQYQPQRFFSANEGNVGPSVVGVPLAAACRRQPGETVQVVDKGPYHSIDGPGRSGGSAFSHGRHYTEMLGFSEPDLTTQQLIANVPVHFYMARIIAVANQKGGVGKTTTTISLGTALRKERKRVLLVDLDPQAALSSTLAAAPDNGAKTVYQVLLGQVKIAEAIRVTQTGPHVLPATIDLSAADLDLAAEMGRERILSDALNSVADRYDFILIDCPPSLGLLTLNALVAAGEVLVPLQCEYLAMRGMNLLLRTVEKVRRTLNPDLAIVGILVTMYNARTVHAREVLEEVRRAFGEQVFPMVVKSSVRFKEAPAAGLSILDYDAAHDGAVAYRDLARRLIK